MAEHRDRLRDDQQRGALLWLVLQPDRGGKGRERKARREDIVENRLAEES